MRRHAGLTGLVVAVLVAAAVAMGGRGDKRRWEGSERTSTVHVMVYAADGKGHQIYVTIASLETLPSRSFFESLSVRRT